MAIGARAACVRGRPQLAEQPQLLQRSLELGAGLAPLDLLERAERRLDRRPLPGAREVGAQPRAQISRTADVQDEPVAPAEEVHARTRRRARDQRALDVQPPGARCRELDEIGDGSRAALLRKPEKHEQDLRRRARVRERPVTGLGRDAEEVRKRREPDAARPLAEQPPREPHGVDDRGRNALPGEPRDLLIEERKIEPRVVSHDRGVARELEQAPDRELGPRRAAKGGGLDPGQRDDRRWQRRARIDERLERVLEPEFANALRADLADPRVPRRKARRLEVEDDEVRVLEEDALAGGDESPTAAPRHASRASPVTTSSRSERASAAGALASANRTRAASSAGTGPRRASTSSTRRSAASKESCMRQMVVEHMFDYQLSHRGEACGGTRASADEAGRRRGSGLARAGRLTRSVHGLLELTSPR